MLQDDPQSVIKAIAVADESQRPEKGIHGRLIAKTVYKLLLRSYIGLGPDKLNDARATMKILEAIASGDPSSDLTHLYVDLGKGLKTELERFRSNGETERFNKLMEAFETFLDDMYKKQEGQTLGSLSWIGETYFALGEISTDASKTASYYDRAASAFNGVLTRAQADSAFATADQLLNVKVRLVRCNRLKKDFSTAEKLLNEVLKARGNDLRTQIEGAYVFQDWGSNGDNKKFVTAIAGNKEIGLWGWGGIAKKIQQQKNFSERPDLVDSFLDARYGVSLCRFRYGKELAPKEKQKALDVCAMELVGSSSIMKTLPDDKRAKLNELYRDVMRESGKPVTDLPWSVDAPLEQTKSKETIDSEDKTLETEKTKPASQPETVTQKKAQEPKNNDTLAFTVFLLSLLCGAGVIGWVFFKGGKKAAKPKTISRKEEPVSFSGIAVEKPQAASFSAPIAPRPRPKPSASTGTGTTAAQPAAPKPVTKSPSRTEGATAPVPKPRPKPPTPPAAD